MDKIIGNIVGIPNPQSDMYQTDPSKADYIHNKMDETELKLRDERLKYYGDPNIVPSDDNLFGFTATNGLEASISEFKDKSISGEIVIPYKCTINGVERIITSISPNTFYSASNITRVVIPSTINIIHYVAFSSCSNLTEINIPDGVKNIGYRCFYNCANLTSLYIPNSDTYMEDAFEGCPNLTITCAECSYADTYAKEHGIPVVYTDEVTKAYVNTVKDELQEWLDEQIGVIVNGEY